MKTIKANKLCVGNIITHQDWTQDLVVQKVIPIENDIKVETIGICQDIHGKEYHIFNKNQDVEIW